MPRRTDTNQAAIMEALRTLGYSVQSLHTVGNGCPDLVIAKLQQTFLVEVKNGSLGWKRTPAQKKFMQRWNAPVPIFETVDDAINFDKQVFHASHRRTENQ